MKISDKDAQRSIHQEINDNESVIVGVVNATGTINLEGYSLKIGVNNGMINIIRNSDDEKHIQNYKFKVSNLETQIQKYLNQLEYLENRQTTDQEKITNAVIYTENLLKKIEELELLISRLDINYSLKVELEQAKERYDIKEIKTLLYRLQIIAKQKYELIENDEYLK